jgi:hypothetical protein
MDEILALAKKEQEEAAKQAKKDAAAKQELVASAALSDEQVAEVGSEAEPDLESGEPGLPAGPRMPDFKGMSYRQVVEVMQTNGINISLRGHGRVIEQSPTAGAAIPYGGTVWVRLSPPGQADAGSPQPPRG